MKFFIGTKEIDKPDTPRFFNVLEVDNQSLMPKELRVYQTDSGVNSGSMRNWGFAWHGDYLYAPNLINGLVKYDKNLNAVASYSGSFPAGTAQKPAQALQAGAQFDRPHQLACLDNRIFICDSGNNLLKVFDLESETFQTVAFDAGKNWINSINLIDGEINIVFHNHGWSDLLVLDKKLKPKYEKNRIGVCAHNIWKMNGERWTCSSREGRLRAIDSNKTIELGGYPRGVTIYDRYLVVGISERRATQSLRRQSQSQAAKRPQRPEISGSGLVFLDLETHAVVATIAFRDLARNPNYHMPYIFELRILDELDQAQHATEPLCFGDISEFLAMQLTL